MIIDLKNIKYQLGANEFEYNFSSDSSITGVFGSSGAGKTTLFNLISGLYKPNEGTLSINNKSIINGQKKHYIKGKNRNIGYVFQENYLFPHLSVKKNLLFSKPYIKKREQYIKLNQVVDVLDLGKLLNKKPQELSGGEKQRVAIGRALLFQPELLLLDEPFSNVDCSKRKQIISYLHKINYYFKTPMLIISHHLEDILKLTNKIAVVKEGKSIVCDDVLNIIKTNNLNDIIQPKKYQNTFKLNYTKFDQDENCHILENDNLRLLVSNQSKLLKERVKTGTKLQLSVRPIDVSISLTYNENSSIQNQLNATVKQIIRNNNNVFCVLDCGFEILVQISDAIIKKLYLHEGQEVFCQIKSHDIDIVHIYNDSEHITECCKNVLSEQLLEI